MRSMLLASHNNCILLDVNKFITSFDAENQIKILYKQRWKIVGNIEDVDKISLRWKFKRSLQRFFFSEHTIVLPRKLQTNLMSLR